MRVCIIVENLPVPADYRVWRIAQTLRKAGHGVTVISPATRGFGAGVEEIEGVRVRRHALEFEARSLWGYPLEYVLALWHEWWQSVREYCGGGFDVIHVCNPPDLLWVIAAIWKVFGVKVVYDHHDLCPELVLAKSGCQRVEELNWVGRVTYSLMVLLERWSHKVADVVLATNESYARIAMERHGIGGERVVVVKTAPRGEEIPAEPARCGASASVPRIGYVGVMARQDGVDGLLRSAAVLCKEFGREFELVLIGDGPEREKLERMVGELGLGDRVIFKGFLPREEVQRELLGCVMGVTPDPACPMNNASTMLKVLDYMACGLPQVAYDLPEHRASAGDAALYAVPGDERNFALLMAQLLDNPALRMELGQIGRRRIRELVWERNGERVLLGVYERLAREA
ncbi:MAG: glycosyltransferase family 4 protein [bacterium]|nr:glycosyltransferase family 4 protein [bacterium]